MFAENQVDGILEEISRCGRWQFVVFNCIAFSLMYQAAIPVVSHSFIGIAPEQVHCKFVDPEASMLGNSSKINERRAGVVGCRKIYGNNGSMTDPQCHGTVEYIFRKDTVATSIVSEFDLVCGYEYLSGTTYTIFVVGEIVGDFIVPYFADRWGRKRTCILSGTLLLAISAALSISTNYPMFAFLKFFYGLFREGMVFTGIVWCLEILPASHRTFAGVGVQLYWPPHWLLFVAMAYFVRQWRSLQLISTIVGGCFFCILFIIPDSLVWLLVNNKIKDVENIITSHVDRFNSIKVNRSILKTMSSPLSSLVEINIFKKPEQNRKRYAETYTLLSIWKNKRARVWCALFSYMWFNSVLCYFGISFLATATPGNLYVNVAIIGAAEIPSYSMGLFLAHRFGRRKPLIFHLILITVVLITGGFLTVMDQSKTLLIVQTCLSAAAKYCATLVFGLTLVYTPEIFPTNIRTMGLCVAVSVGNIAQLMTPFTVDIFRVYSWLPFAIFSFTSLVAAFAVYLLPETGSKPLPNTFDDLEQLDAVGFRSK